MQQILSAAACNKKSSDKACSLPLSIGVFFDVVGKNADTDPVAQWTNVGLLAQAFPRSGKEKLARVYVPGLAAKFESDNGSYFKAVGKSAAAEKAGALQDDWKKKMLQGKVKDIFAELKQIPKSLQKGMRNFERGLAKVKGNPLLGVAHGGLTMTRVFKSMLWKLPLSAATAVPYLRDSKALMTYNLGVDVRVKYAVSEVLSAVKKNAADINELNVYVYGAERGGPLARMFLNALQEECKQTSAGLILDGIEGAGKKPIKVKLPFLGLFDCISSLAGSEETFGKIKEIAGYLVPVPLPETSIEGDKTLSATVASTYHLVAGHELRSYQRVDSVAKGGGKVRERVLPGSSEDVTGDIRDGDAKSSDLARVALWLMYQESIALKVPLLPFKELESRAKAVAARFYLSKTVSVNGRTLYADDLVQAYEKQLGAKGDLRGALQANVCAWLAWLKGQKDKQRDPNAGRDPRKPTILKPGQAPPDINDILSRRATPLAKDLIAIHAGEKPDAKLWKAWEHGPAPTPEQAALFAQFMHDPYDVDIDRQFWLFMPGNSGFYYFRWREVDADNAEPLVDEDEKQRQAFNKQLRQDHQRVRAEVLARQKEELTTLNQHFAKQRQVLLQQGQSTEGLDMAYQAALKAKTSVFNKELANLP
ncbi:DUF2235 domain-containing protein (plasmid) [Chromobacterium amazonense]|uniref:DUF2235 domain-containing protein n=1 Tax=Chromobacterium amazonense TaxID=1382803 RepID=UPI00237E7395|nr:DUF2235 domain-containing protein [Chromobacterium amazonense]MDE1714411.1 DUF2235 domain-containing protein [Chromobacterium amazonense]